MMINRSRPVPAHTGSFRTFIKDQAAGHAILHEHPCYEMNFVIKGAGTRHVGTREDSFEEGDLILLGPGIPHKWVNDAPSQADYSSLVMQWDETFIERMCQVTPEFYQIGKLLTMSSKGIVFKREFGKEIEKSQESLLTLPPFKRLLLLLEILHDFAESGGFDYLSEEGFFSKQTIPNSRIEKVLEFVEEKYADKITLKMVSSIVNMSEGAFSRFFSRSFKKPFFTYLNEFRVGKSYELLKTTDLRVNEIGYACGYECLQFFYRQFMKYTNCAPQEYRSRFLEGKLFEN